MRIVMRHSSILILFLVVSHANSQPADFRSVRWGMTEAQVRALEFGRWFSLSNMESLIPGLPWYTSELLQSPRVEDLKPHPVGNDSLMVYDSADFVDYFDTIMKAPALITYEFVGDSVQRLIGAIYSLAERHRKAQEWLERFRDCERTLSKQYGRPVWDSVVTDNGLHWVSVRMSLNAKLALKHYENEIENKSWEIPTSLPDTTTQAQLVTAWRHGGTNIYLVLREDEVSANSDIRINYECASSPITDRLLPYHYCKRLE